MTDPAPDVAAAEMPAAEIRAAVGATETRLVLIGADGEYVKGPGNRIVGVVLNGITNADARTPIGLEVEQRCDMGHWHSVGRTQLPHYSRVWPAETAP